MHTIEGMLHVQCMSCGSPLTTGAREGVSIEQCEACQGVWLDVGELRSLLHAREIPTDALERAAAVAARRRTPDPDELESASRHCPTCNEPMERVNYDEASGILVDSCMEHGVWLDGGELSRLETWAEAWDDQLAAPPVSPELVARRAALDDAWGDDESSGPLGLFAASWRWRQSQRDNKRAS
jgi:Zn-finger nucleic acid-binding protein